jgi:hypothetical protein
MAHLGKCNPLRQHNALSTYAVGLRLPDRFFLNFLARPFIALRVCESASSRLIFPFETTISDQIPVRGQGSAFPEGCQTYMRLYTPAHLPSLEAFEIVMRVDLIDHCAAPSPLRNPNLFTRQKEASPSLPEVFLILSFRLLSSLHRCRLTAEKWLEETPELRKIDMDDS